MEHPCYDATGVTAVMPGCVLPHASDNLFACLFRLPAQLFPEPEEEEEEDEEEDMGNDEEGAGYEEEGSVAGG